MKKKKVIGLVSLLIVILGLAVVIPMHINKLDTTKLDEIAQKTKDNKKVSEYFDDVWMNEVEKMPGHVYDISLSAKSNFKDLSDEEKLILLGNVTDTIQENSRLNSIECGRNKSCSINEVFVLPNKNDKAHSYTIKYDPVAKPEDNVLHVYRYQNDDRDSTLINTTEVKLSQGETDHNEKIIYIGMSKSDVLLDDWGKPLDVKKTTTAYGTNEQWIYSGNR
ncbi:MULTISPECIES: hypothetical protein [Bacillus]|uniref:hypothetical protein n=1 Tax=Bacillus TaxID=1386 RepID=UPI0008F8BA6F|nr:MULTISPECIES: hypothetical protein [Bacillus amyloliquefaciens group]ASS61330.1 hypothetical protein CHN56_00786 [Bacillus velezensis]ATC52686.1 hypothetical protein CLI97_03462 [Bacillus velezensis]MCW5194318.1 hypothetical protein [Bacillus amyloliquefaciens]QOC81017.1 hypothetical protein ID168_06840 [Bacillus velezensis]QQY06702.1 hypothetical protein JKJ03_06780 [Bacillus velezensis]